MLPAFITALRVKPPSFPPALRVKRVQGTAGVWEVTFASDGRATFAYGGEVLAGEPHVIWRRVGTHDVLGGSVTPGPWGSSRSARWPSVVNKATARSLHRRCRR